MNKAYNFQSSLILYFFNAAGRTLKHGSSNVTLKLFAALCAASFALEISLSVGGFVSGSDTSDWGLTTAIEVEGWVVGSGAGFVKGVVVAALRMELADAALFRGGGG
jgi:hypothetical protein